MDMSLVLLQLGVNRTARLKNLDLTALTGDAVYSWGLQSQVVLDLQKEIRYFPGREAHRLDVVKRQHPADVVEYRLNISMKATESGFLSGWAKFGGGLRAL
jgi:hypothetical protein